MKRQALWFAAIVALALAAAILTYELSTRPDAEIDIGPQRP